MTLKRFQEADNTAVFTTIFVLRDKKDITHVTHDEEDGAWQFFSNDDFEDFEKIAKIVGLGEIVELDNTLLEIADLPEGYQADRRFKGDRWVINKKNSFISVSLPTPSSNIDSLFSSGLRI